jgi:lipopolysaccharide export system permease protein
VVIFRYLSKDILISALALSMIIFFISLTGRFVNLLAEAAAGKYAVGVLFTMIGYHVPGLLQIILPLAFYIAILLSFGRLYVESEMVVLFACGMSQRQLLWATLMPAFMVALVVALFSLWLTPLGEQLNEKILEEQRNRSEFDTLNAGRFQTLGQNITFVDELTSNRKRLENVFIAHDDSDKSRPMVAVAKYGEQIQSSEYDQRYLVLHDGIKYEGQPGSADFRVMHFVTYGQYMPQAIASGDYTSETDAKPSLELFFSQDPSLRAAFQWRLALPIMVFVGTLLAVPLSRSSPRQGRFLKMFPAILIYILYYTFLGNVNGAMSSGKWPIVPGLWVVHFVFIALALLLFNWENFNLWQRRRMAEFILKNKNAESNRHA